MKTILISLMALLLASCNGGSSGGSGAQLDPDLRNGIWAVSYVDSDDGKTYEEWLNFQESIVLIQVYDVSGGFAKVSEEVWHLAPLTAKSVQVKTGTDTFTVVYEIDGNTLSFCADTMSCYQYTR